MEIEITNSENYPVWIDSYQENQIVVNQQVYQQPILIYDGKIKLIEKPLTGFTIQDFILDSPYQPEFILLGTGKNHYFLPDQLLVQLFQKGLPVETMNTASASHTFNLLIADKRNIWTWFWLK